jgi:hypothetical protein
MLPMLLLLPLMICSMMMRERRNDGGRSSVYVLRCGVIGFFFFTSTRFQCCRMHGDVRPIRRCVPEFTVSQIHPDLEATASRQGCKGGRNPLGGDIFKGDTQGRVEAAVDRERDGLVHHVAC